MFALSWIHVLVEIRPIKFRQSVRIFWKMRRHPIDDHSDPGLVAFIDKMAEFVRSSEATGWRIIVSHLIAPRSFEGMLRDWKQFEMGITHIHHVRQQGLGKLHVTQ